MFASIRSAVVVGVDGSQVSVEVHVGAGLPGMTIVGLPDASCREARDRVRAAFIASKLTWPPQKVTVNLAPSSSRKVGTGLDLPIAVGILVASGVVDASQVNRMGFVGELGLDGSVRAVPAIVPLVDAIRVAGGDEVVVPVACAGDAELLEEVKVRAISTLSELVAALSNEEPWPDHDYRRVEAAPLDTADLADLRGQPIMRRALEISAAGGHHLLMIGVPGAGKTMLAERLPGVLPDLSSSEAMEVSRIHSAAGRVLTGGLVRRPPFQAPHHSATLVSVIGGGSDAMRPGLVSLAHGGVLFLDELSEFSPSVLDALRQPIEEGAVRVSRARFSAMLPARFLLVAAMNPCPCGEGGRPGACSCSDAALLRYRRRLSGPLLDRFDLRVAVERPDAQELLTGAPGEPSAVVAERVARVRAKSLERGGVLNSRMSRVALDEYAPLSNDAQRLLGRAMEMGRLTARGLDRIRRVALTMADLEGVDPPLEPMQVAAALSLRADISLHPGVAA
ncbi:MAG: YifB family Mg chelatase-like AAA ATPase [Acidimicrobiales bacterium]|nr:YifB family Mg chelatase-like AAA ATPase [Acidimicrobiales bacterium]